MEFFADLKCDDNGLLPVIIQEEGSGTVLMHAYTDLQALKLTLKTGKVHFFSRSRNCLWQKGETSGNFLYVKKIMTDCDCDTLLITVEQVEAACHTGKKTCFFRELEQGQLTDIKPHYSSASMLYRLFGIIQDRRENPKEGAYTNYLFDKGIDKILKKVGEEAAEVIIAAKNNSKEEVRYEVSDLLYHVMVLISECGLTPGDIYEELELRHKN